MHLKGKFFGVTKENILNNGNDWMNTNRSTARQPSITPVQLSDDTTSEVMADEDNFDLGKMLTDSLNLQSNCCSATRHMYPGSLQNPYKELTEKHYFEILGLKDFQEKIVKPEDTTGSSIHEFYRGVNVLVTGGTGFVGKLLTEKLIREIPWIGQIYLLVRPKRGISSGERFDRLMDDKVFQRMKAEVPSYRDKMAVVEGDLSLPELGLRPEDRQMIVERVQVVFHSAADVKFTEPLRVAMESNVIGSKRVLDLAKNMKHLKAYVHVSTAYSQCVRTVIEEMVPKMTVNYKDLVHYLETRTDEEIEEELQSLLQGWPNTYVFTKAVCEDMLQEEAVGLPVTIFRPSIVYPSYREPVRGYTDNMYGPLAFFVGAGHGVAHCQRMDTELALDIVPVDYTVNCMIVLAAQTARRGDWVDIPVYNFTATSQKLTIWKIIIEVALSDDAIQFCPFDRSIWYTSFLTTKSSVLNELGCYLLHDLPGLLLDKLAVWSGGKPRLMKIYSKAQSIKSNAWYFGSRQWDFRNNNTINLWNGLDPVDKAKFNFDLMDIDVIEHFFVCKVGMKYFHLKENLEDMEKAKRKNIILYWAHQVLKAGCYLIALKVMVCVAHVLPL